MVSPDRKLILPKLNFQLETDRLNGVCTKNMIENFTEMVLNLSEEVGQLCKNTHIKIENGKYLHGRTTQCPTLCAGVIDTA
jgi:hypothetical protein